MLQEASVLSSHLRAYKPAVESYTSAAGHFFDSVRDFMASSGAVQVLYIRGMCSELPVALAYISSRVDVNKPSNALWPTPCAPEDRLYPAVLLVYVL
jgi:hypothetical protein